VALLLAAPAASAGAERPAPCPGPICVRPEGTPLSHLAGFGIALGGILITARGRRRDRG
jgi:hypothetical protein